VYEYLSVWIYAGKSGAALKYKRHAAMTGSKRLQKLCVAQFIYQIKI
jgi:hypothetical protein